MTKVHNKKTRNVTLTCLKLKLKIWTPWFRLHQIKTKVDDTDRIINGIDAVFMSVLLFSHHITNCSKYFQIHWKIDFVCCKKLPNNLRDWNVTQE